MTDRLAWQKQTALAHRARKEQAAKADGVAMSDHALDVLAAAYVGATADQVKAWRSGR
jgi:hypothetical protein